MTSFIAGLLLASSSLASALYGGVHDPHANEMRGLDRAVHVVHRDVHNSSAPSNSSIADSPILSPQNSTKWWYELINHDNAQAPYMSPQHKKDYNVFRNVAKDFGADPSGEKDASRAIQNAINAGPSHGPKRNVSIYGSSNQPAVVYIPSGTYRVDTALAMQIGTVLVGDVLNPPILKASSQFHNGSDSHVIYGLDPHQIGTNNFFIAIKNLVIDTTEVSRHVDVIDWTVSQATQLSNIKFNMRQGSSHSGVTMAGANSNIILNDLTFNGGANGVAPGGQQYILKNIKTKGTRVGVNVQSAFNLVCLQCSFEDAHIGINSTAVSGSLVVIGSSGKNIEDSFVRGSKAHEGSHSIILEDVNVINGVGVKTDSKAVVNESVSGPWVYGNMYAPGYNTVSNSTGDLVRTNRPKILAPKQTFHVAGVPPSFGEYSVHQVLNIKNVPGLPVHGDGHADDTASINAILTLFAGHKVIYFPAGTYIVSDTITFPIESRIIGDAYASVISATGDKFKDETAPKVLAEIGKPGDKGTLTVVDMMFSVSDLLPGCQLMEVNAAGNNPGDVSIFNTHFRIGGTSGTTFEFDCFSHAEKCKAASGVIHLTPSSSAYIENLWGWTADHNLDANTTNKLAISTGRGLLVEATEGTWLVGTAMEHHTLYQYNYYNARNVFSAFQQTETPYWQGYGSVPAPDIWFPSLTPADPNFSWCSGNSTDAQCPMALFENIVNSRDLFLYNGMVWTFFNNLTTCPGSHCQTNAINMGNSSQVFQFGFNVAAVKNMIMEDGTPIAPTAQNKGGWSGCIGAYLRDTQKSLGF